MIDIRFSKVLTINRIFDIPYDVIEREVKEPLPLNS